MTLKAVYEARLFDKTATSIESSFLGFFRNIQALASKDYQQALILSGMLFTLVIWVFSFLFLLVGVIFYILFLWHWIPKADGGLSGYCERKVNKALLKIVTDKVKEARHAEFRAAKNAEKPGLDRKATLPTLPNVEGGDKLPAMPMIHRSETTTTLPAYTSRPSSPGSFELNSLDQKRPMPARTGTMTSTTSFSSRAPLVGGAADMGFGNDARSPAASVPPLDFNNYPPARPGTANSQRSFAHRPQLSRTYTHNTQNSSSSFTGLYAESPATYGAETMPPFPPPVRSPTARTMDSYRGPMGRDNFSNPRPSPTTRSTYDDYSDGRASPVQSMYSTRGLPPLPRTPAAGNGPYQPMRSATNPQAPRGPQYPPQRNMTAPVPPRGPTGEEYPPRNMSASVPPRNMSASAPPRQPGGDDYFNRPTTAGSQRGQPAGPNRNQGYGYDMDMESQRDRRY